MQNICYYQKIYLLIVVLVTSLVAGAQKNTGIFKTFEEYKNSKAMPCADVDYNGKKLMVKQLDGTETQYSLQDIWGFQLENEVFRTNKDGIYQIESEGAIVLYTFAEVHLTLLHNRSYYKWNEVNRPYYYVSKNTNTDIYATAFNVSNTETAHWGKKQFGQFLETYPEFEPLNECIAKKKKSTEFVICVTEFNAARDKTMQFKQRTIDLGQIKIEYQNLATAPAIKSVFNFTNISQASIEIDKINGSESVTTDFTKGEIKQGNTGVINVAILPSAYTKNSFSNNVPPGEYKMNFSTPVIVKFKSPSITETIYINGTFVIVVSK